MPVSMPQACRDWSTTVQHGSSQVDRRLPRNPSNSSEKTTQGWTREKALVQQRTTSCRKTFCWDVGIQGQSPDKTHTPLRMERRPSRRMAPVERIRIGRIRQVYRSVGFAEHHRLPDTPRLLEHQITGNVLLELDINLLKEEIGIAAFGDRMRITNAIAELHRSPSVILADDQPHAQSITHSVSQSFSDASSLSGSTLIGSPSVGSPDSLDNPEVDTFTSPRISKRVSSMSTASSSVFAGVEKAGIFQVAGLGLGALPETRLSSAPEEELHEDYNVQSEVSVLWFLARLIVKCP